MIFLCKNSPFCNPDFAIYNKIVRLRALFYYIIYIYSCKMPHPLDAKCPRYALMLCTYTRTYM